MVYVGIAGAAVIGAWLRFILQSYAAVFAPGFPYGTLAANCIGCFLIGFLFPLMTSWPIEARLAIVTGFLGSLTTLSSLSWEVVQLFGDKRYVAALTHWLAGAVGGIVLASVGWWIGDKLAR